jgi:hypothetical protein
VHPDEREALDSRPGQAEAPNAAHFFGQRHFWQAANSLTSENRACKILLTGTPGTREIADKSSRVHVMYR